MHRLSLFASLVALGMGTASVANRQQPNFANANESSQMTDGAFRDGLYLGRLAAERGLAPRVAIGRWATEADRASFIAGYQRGYNEAGSQDSPQASAGEAAITGVATVVGIAPGPKPVSMSTVVPNRIPKRYSIRLSRIQNVGYKTWVFLSLTVWAIALLFRQRHQPSFLKRRS